MAKDYQIPEPSIDDITLLEPEAVYSYADYLKWTFEERVELIKGRLFPMSPAPSRIHQEVSGNLLFIIKTFLKGTKCRVYAAPFDVRFPQKRGDKDAQIFTVVQPDICVVCDEHKLDEKGCIGAPDLIVEILSPITSAKDLKNKFFLYEEFEVREYWVAYPNERVLEIFSLDENGKYRQFVKYTLGDTVSSRVLNGLSVGLNDLFED